jgi:hypothetical protein
MNEQKFLFVTCVNDEILYNRCLKHIKNLNVPTGFTVDFLAIRGANSITEGYNQALSHDAKYKIYLHQDTFIINPFFLQDIWHLFKYNPALGLIGVAGCKKLPVNGVWWNANDVVGKAIAFPNQTFTLYTLRDVEDSFESVEAIDGFLMVTQYDIPWREDIIDGFHFYDACQSLEFIKRGYLVGVPKQMEPWSIHYYDNQSPNLTEFTRLQQKFLQYYT